MSRPRRDAAARALALATALLPRSQAAWRAAMRAELDAIGDRAERRRFVLGCTRAVVTVSIRDAGVVACAAGLVVLSSVVGAAVPLVLIVALLLARGGRQGALGPCRPSSAARGVRAAGLALVLGLVATRAVQGGSAGLVESGRGDVLWTLALGGLAAAFLATTASATRVADAALATGAGAGLAAGIAGFALLPYDRIGTPLAHGLPGGGAWLVAIVLAAPAAAAVVTAARTRSSDQSVPAVACAGAFAALTVALLGFGSIALVPGSVPDVAGSAMWPGTPAAARRAADAAEASDPYWGYLVLGVLVALLLWALARPPRRSAITPALLAGLAVPAVALALAGHAGTIALATAAVVLVAVARTRRGVATVT